MPECTPRDGEGLRVPAQPAREARRHLRRAAIPIGVAIVVSATVGLAVASLLVSPSSVVEPMASSLGTLERSKSTYAPPPGKPPAIRVRPLVDAERPALVRQALEEAVRWAEAGDLEQAGLYHSEASLLAGDGREILSALGELERRYRRACEVEGRFAPIRAAFEREDFHTALALLYRLPAAAESPRVRNALANGWYDLAIVALRAGRCDEAWRDLVESAASGASFELHSEARAIAVRCRTGSVERRLMARAESLRFRGPDD